MVKKHYDSSPDTVRGTQKRHTKTIKDDNIASSINLCGVNMENS